MSLVVLENVALGFGEQVLFSELGLRLAEGDRVGLVGPNGSGKTTLLKIMAGEQQPDDGSVSVSRGVSIGYLPQDLAIEGGQTLIDFVTGSVPGREGLDQALVEAESELDRAQIASDDDAMMEAAERIADLHDRILHFEQFFSEFEALRILGGLGFSPTDHQRDLGEFSGGWKMRAVLAGLLFQKPDLLLLDEPTNHLDMPSVAWFSQFLKSYKRAFVLISHDREFLNEQIARVVSIEPEGIRHYTGNYDQYKKQRAEEETILENKAKNLERERERLQRFVDRFRAQANKAAAVQSRVKALEKMEDVERYQRRRVMRFNFPPTSRPVTEVIKVEHLRKAYGDLVVFPDLSLTVRRGQRIGIIGTNGAGKTTLLRMIAGELAPSSGEINLGSGVEVGYYAQHHADVLHRGSTVLQEVTSANPDESPGRIRKVLGAFLFSGDTVDKPIAVLSGGERARVALAKLLIRPGNVLLMDEPSNHL
ncbi:MAG: ATP-binding cassette domain-containing protein, partial [Deltaproteobacteria bacterium]|nr:ATP-binding cassette domain-containing protein [Deltaproteobacteria bacterium]